MGGSADPALKITSCVWPSLLVEVITTGLFPLMLSMAAALTETEWVWLALPPKPRDEMAPPASSWAEVMTTVWPWFAEIVPSLLLPPPVAGGLEGIVVGVLE